MSYRRAMLKRILEPSNPPTYFGGEDLEDDLREAKRSGRLFGILNGCEYPDHRDHEPLKRTFGKAAKLLKHVLREWIERCAKWPKMGYASRRPGSCVR